ncbi:MULTISPECIES: ABC transporter permease [unclassified Streptosporangium]|uniref:ABC transporter permease n=1 Tax=Streptosporangium sp. NPDC005286 TaxID=3154463 RepID=UPI0033BEEA08
MTVQSGTREHGRLQEKRRSKKRSPIARTLVPAMGFVLFVALWEAVVRAFAVPVYLVPAPSEVFTAFVDNWELIYSNTGQTAQEAFLGFAIGNAAAIALAVVFVMSPFLERLTFPIVVGLRTVPIIAIAPILIIIFGNDATPKIVIAALISFFPTLVNAIVGFKNVDPKMLELMAILSARPWETFLRVRVFSALPFIFSALKIATGNCVLGAVVGEWIGADRGLGYLIIQSTFDFNTTLLYATMLVVSILAIIAFGLVAVAEKLIVRWEQEPAR